MRSWVAEDSFLPVATFFEKYAVSLPSALTSKVNGIRVFSDISNRVFELFALFLASSMSPSSIASTDFKSSRCPKNRYEDVEIIGRRTRKIVKVSIRIRDAKIGLSFIL